MDTSHVSTCFWLELLKFHLDMFQDQQTVRRYPTALRSPKQWGEVLQQWRGPLPLQPELRTPLKQKALSSSNKKRGCRQWEALQIKNDLVLASALFSFPMKRYTGPDCELCNLQLFSCRLASAENILSREFLSSFTPCRAEIQQNGRRDRSEVSK